MTNEKQIKYSHMKQLKYTFFVLFFITISCEEIIMEQDISNENVQLLAPSNNAVLAVGAGSFNWDIVKGADKYKLQIATPNFAAANQVVVDTLITNTNFSKNLTAKTYQWRVKAINSAYETAYSVHDFTVE